MQDLTFQLSAQRDEIYDAVCDRFKQLFSEERIDDALALADEFFEWMDPEQLENEPTVFVNSDEVRALYQQMTNG